MPLFGSPRQAEPQQPWRLQLLTTDYLVDAQMPPSNVFFASAYVDDDEVNIFNDSIHVRQLQPTGNFVLPSFLTWNGIFRVNGNVIAIIPQDDACLRAAQKEFKDFQSEFPATFLAGAYCIQGTLLSEDEDGTTNAPNFIPVRDARIDCLAPNAKLTGFQVPWLLVFGRTLQVDGLTRA
jgi:hypothetical protein